MSIKVRKASQKKNNSTDINLLVNPESKSEYFEWDKQKIVTALREEANITKKLAGEIAESVEKRVINSQLSSISSSLIRELIDNELFDRGLQSVLQAQQSIGLPKYDINELIYNKSQENSNIGNNNPEAVGHAISETILKQYALQEVFSTHVAEAHRNGVIHLHDLGYICRLYCSGHSVEYLKKYGLELGLLESVSGPAKHARTLTTHINSFLSSMQAFYAGALGLSFVNVMYAPYVEHMSDVEMLQEAQHLIFQTSQNAYTRGGQTLFVDFNLHAGVPGYLKNIDAIGPGGEYTGRTYASYEDAATRFAKALLTVWGKGDKYGTPFAFPKCFDQSTMLLCKIDNNIKVKSLQDIYDVFFGLGCNIQLPHPDNQWTTITNMMEIPQSHGITIHLANNITLSSLNDHKYPTYDNGQIIEKEAQQLQIGDTLLYYNIQNNDEFIDDTFDKYGLLVIKDITFEEIKPIALEVDAADHRFITADGIVTRNCDFHINQEVFDNPKQYEILQLACDITAQNGIVYFMFDRDEVTMAACCRLRTVIEDNHMIDHPESLRFTGFQNVTINLPQCAYRVGKNNIKEFYNELDHVLKICIDAHVEKRKFIKHLMSAPNLPLWQVGRLALDGRPYVDLDNATYIIGLIGLNECVHYLFGHELHENEETMWKGLRIVSYLYFAVKEWGQKLGMKFTIEESPAESASRRLAKMDTRHFPDAIVRGNRKTDDVYYTNSIHIRPDAPVDLISRITMQARFHGLIESGAIIHAFVGENLPNSKSLINLLRKVYNQTNCAQLTISPEFTICKACNTTSMGLSHTCPNCQVKNTDIHYVDDDDNIKVMSWNKKNLKEI